MNIAIIIYLIVSLLLLMFLLLESIKDKKAKYKQLKEIEKDFKELIEDEQ